MDATGVLTAIDTARAETRRRALEEIERVEARRDADLIKLDRATQALADEGEPTVGPSPSPRTSPPPESDAPPKPKRRVRRKRLPATTQEQLAERCDQIARLVEESADGPAFKEICQTLGLTSHRARTGVQTLIEERRIKPVGTGSSTRYRPADARSGPLFRQPPTQGTLEERIVTILEDRHRTKPAELAQALRKPLQEVNEACGRLQAEERIKMDRHNGRPVYVLAVRV
jgi:hypothetical protein